MHVVFVKAGLPVDPSHPDFQDGTAFKKVQSGWPALWAGGQAGAGRWALAADAGCRPLALVLTVVLALLLTVVLGEAARAQHADCHPQQRRRRAGQRQPRHLALWRRPPRCRPPFTPAPAPTPPRAGLVSYLPRPKDKVGVNLLSGEGIPNTEVRAWPWPPGPWPQAQAQRPALPDPQPAPPPPTSCAPTRLPPAPACLPPPQENKEAEKARVIVSFLKPNMTIAMIDHFQAYPKKGIPPPVGGGARAGGGAGGGAQRAAGWRQARWMHRHRLLRGAGGSGNRWRATTRRPPGCRPGRPPTRPARPCRPHLRPPADL